MNKYLPSKQFARTIVITIGVGIVLFFVGNLLVKKTTWEQKRNNLSVSASGGDDDYFSKDSDGDGLFDWEEAIWGTNPFLASSRDDGVSDYDYVQNKKKNITFSDEYKPNLDNDTEVFARQLFTTSAVLNRSGALNQGDIERFNTGLEISMNSFSVKDKYTLANLKMSNISPAEYSQKINDIYKNAGSSQVNELSLIAYMAENPNDPDALEELSGYLEYSEKIINGYLTTNVPHGIAGTHLSIINDIYKISEVVKQSYHLENDPLRTAMYLGKYDEYTDSLMRNINSLRTYFTSNGII